MSSIIYLDLDGPMVDWQGGVYKLFGENPEKTDGMAHEVLGVSKSEIWKRVYRAGSKWWAELEPTPWARELYDGLQKLGEVVILSSPSHIAAGSSGKVRWMKDFFNGNFRDYILTSRKELLAKPGDILVDDLEKNTTKFTDHGGTGILFPCPWNSARADVDRALEVTLKAVGSMPTPCGF